MVVMVLGFWRVWAALVLVSVLVCVRGGDGVVMAGSGGDGVVIAGSGGDDGMVMVGSGGDGVVIAGSGGDDGVAMVGSGGEAEGIIVKAGERTRATPDDTTDSPTMGPCFVDDLNCDIEDLACSTQIDCHNAFPNLEVALQLAEDTPLKPSPICVAGKCTCGKDRCVSQSRTFGRNVVYYYCGECGFVGSRCVSDGNCTNEKSDCRGSYCSCNNDGTFYEFYYCEIPYVGYETALQMAIIVCIVIALCFLIASIYTVVLSRRLTRLPRILQRERDNLEATNDGPPNDTPPTYDDVVDKLPSYQDALEMTVQDDGTDGLPQELDERPTATRYHPQDAEGETSDIVERNGTERNIVEREDRNATLNNGYSGTHQLERMSMEEEGEIEVNTEINNTATLDSPPPVIPSALVSVRPRHRIQPIELPLHEALEMEMRS